MEGAGGLNCINGPVTKPYAECRIIRIAHRAHLRDQSATFGCWPVVIGGRDDWDEVKSRAAEPSSRAPTELIQAGLELDFAEWRKEQIEEAKADAESEGDPAASRLALAHGPWPEDHEPTTDFTAHSEHDPVVIALLPSPDSWTAAAYLQFGGWNDCPYPEVQVAAFKHWHETYGAEIFAIARDVVEAAIARPPVTREDALALALEQFVFCADIVDQGTRTIEALGAELLGAPVWFFWWD